MSKVESRLGNGPGKLGRDPVTGVLVAMRDAWMDGIVVMASACQPSAAGSNPGASLPGGPMIGMLGAMADLATGKAADSTMGGQQNSTAADLVLPMGDAMMIAANRSVSYWLSLAQILVTHQAKSVRAVGVKAIGEGGAGSEHFVARDELRALLREVGDLTTREARLLQHELGVLGESLVQASQPPDPSAPFRRRWRAKV